MIRHRLVLACLVAAEATVVVLGVIVVHATFSLDQQPCNENDTFPGGLIVLAGAAALVTGHLSGHWRRVTDRRHRSPAGRLRWLQTTRVLHGALAAFFAMGLVLLIYEAIGLNNPWGLHPITHYVRCAKTVSPGVTTAFTAAISFLCGHWLWYPDRRPRR